MRCDPQVEPVVRRALGEARLFERAIRGQGVTVVPLRPGSVEQEIGGIVRLEAGGVSARVRARSDGRLMVEPRTDAAREVPNIRAAASMVRALAEQRARAERVRDGMLRELAVYGRTASGIVLRSAEAVDGWRGFGLVPEGPAPRGFLPGPILVGVARMVRLAVRVETGGIHGLEGTAGALRDAGPISVAEAVRLARGAGWAPSVQ